MLLLETTKSHWLLLIVDLRRHYFFIYDSLSSVADKNRPALLNSAMNHSFYLWLEVIFCVSFEPTVVGGVNYVTHVVVNVATCAGDCISTCSPMVQHLH